MLQNYLQFILNAKFPFMSCLTIALKAIDSKTLRKFSYRMMVVAKTCETKIALIGK
jgi:hypothetical protein